MILFGKLFKRAVFILFFFSLLYSLGRVSSEDGINRVLSGKVGRCQWPRISPEVDALERELKVAQLISWRRRQLMRVHLENSISIFVKNFHKHLSSISTTP